MALVLDASIALSWLLNEPHRGLADTVIEEGLSSGLAAPELFWIEVANVLGQHVRRRRMTASERDEALGDLLNLAILRHRSAERILQIVGLSDRHQLTAYDAAYLELALRLDAALATLDRDLAAAGKAEGLRVLTG